MPKIATRKFGRLTDLYDFFSPIIEDLTLQEGDRPAEEWELEDGSFYRVICMGINITFEGRTETTNAYFYKPSAGWNWQEADQYNVDKLIYPNGKHLRADNSLILYSSKLYDILDETSPAYEDDLTKEILDTSDPENPVSFEPKKYQKKLKSDARGYYTYLRYSALGRGMENSWFSDNANRLVDYLPPTT